MINTIENFDMRMTKPRQLWCFILSQTLLLSPILLLCCFYSFFFDNKISLFAFLIMCVRAFFIFDANHSHVQTGVNLFIVMLCFFLSQLISINSFKSKTKKKMKWIFWFVDLTFITLTMQMHKLSLHLEIVHFNRNFSLSFAWSTLKKKKRN